MSNIFAFLRRLPFSAKNKILTVGLQSLVLIAAGGGAFAANAFPSSVTQNGLAWLSSQVQASGGMAAGGAQRVMCKGLKDAGPHKKLGAL